MYYHLIVNILMKIIYSFYILQDVLSRQLLIKVLEISKKFQELPNFYYIVKLFLVLQFNIFWYI